MCIFTVHLLDEGKALDKLTMGKHSDKVSLHNDLMQGLNNKVDSDAITSSCKDICM